MSEIQFRSGVDVELVDSLGDEQSIIRAARVSTFGAMAEKEEAAGLLRYLIRNNHGTARSISIVDPQIDGIGCSRIRFRNFGNKTH